MGRRPRCESLRRRREICGKNGGKSERYIKDTTVQENTQVLGITEEGEEGEDILENKLEKKERQKERGMNKSNERKKDRKR